MDLVTSWRNRAIAASGAALIVPVAVLSAAAVVGLGGGGFGGLGSLDQLVSGPAAPPGAEQGLEPEKRIAQVANRARPVPVVAVSVRKPAPGAPATSGVGAPASRVPVRARGPRPTSPPRAQTPTGETPTRQPPQQRLPVQTQTPPPAPAPAPAPPRGPLAPVGDLTRPISKALPDSIGQPVQGLVDGLTGSRP